MGAQGILSTSKQNGLGETETNEASRHAHLSPAAEKVFSLRVIRACVGRQLQSAEWKPTQTPHRGLTFCQYKGVCLFTHLFNPEAKGSEPHYLTPSDASD